ncbi:hypothetical protein GSI_06560 [Ganoderma sinense ZZ0214-1]|uniref:Delta 8-(E)-sphingolipid desaturase n=1 Tax=Ganoderma sinense ZZ0214-1 TaxID=1077348 RepID=A0A2G8SDK2_9APHY|nr:hypothetical protein GSI_06560 [Ganoderma sinense ZZ0214-1]
MGLPPTQVWTREQVAARILAGETLFVLHGNLVRVPPSWLSLHPGGNLSILHYVGRDASAEAEAFHSPETVQRMKDYVVGQVEMGENGWAPFVPPYSNGWVRRKSADGKMEWYSEARAVKVTTEAEASILLFSRDGATPSELAPTMADLEPAPNSLSMKNEKLHSEAYRKLHQRVKDAGLYQCRYVTGYGPDVVRYSLLVAIGTVCYSKGWLIPSAICLGLFWQQVTFAAHDLGHVAVTHHWTLDRFISIFLANFMGGVSISWWVNLLPFFAISPVFFKSLWSSFYQREMTFDAPSRFFLSMQHKLFYVVLSLARFNLYVRSYNYLLKTAFEPPRARGGGWWWWAEVFALGLFFTWFGAVLKGCGSWPNVLMYLLVSHMASSLMHVQIVLSHFSRSIADLGPVESFFARQLRTTVDVICPESIEFIHGGLHLQVTHHLFPRLPRHNLRKASLIVKEFAKERGLEYAEFGWTEGNGEVRGVLKQVADQIKIIGMVADSEVRDAMKS